LHEGSAQEEREAQGVPRVRSKKRDVKSGKGDAPRKESIGGRVLAGGGRPKVPLRFRAEYRRQEEGSPRIETKRMTKRVQSGFGEPVIQSRELCQGSYNVDTKLG